MVCYLRLIAVSFGFQVDAATVWIRLVNYREGIVCCPFLIQ